MLIEIDPSIQDRAEELTTGEWDALNNLAIAAREGSHFLLPIRKTANFLAQHPKIGQREQQLYRLLSSRHTTLAPAKNHFKTITRVSLTLVEHRQHIGGQLIIELPLKFFANTASIQPAILVGENLRDCTFIIELARAYAHVNGIQAVRTIFDKRPGGGVTTGQVVDNILQEGSRLLLVIVDSDRLTPNGSLGDTAKKTMRALDSAPSVSAECIILESRELENLLPIEFFEQMFGEHPDHKVAANFLARLEQATLFVPRLYIDIKNGLSLSELLHPDKKPNDFDFVWRPVIEAIALSTIECQEPAKRCAKNGRCLKPKECECNLAAANRTDLLSEGANFYRRNRKRTWTSMPEQLRAASEIVARRAFDWGGAMQIQAT